MTQGGQQRLAGKAAIVTGGSRGIGKAIAAAYIAAGARVFICGRDAAAVQAAVAGIDGGRAAAGIAGDVGDPEAARRIVGTALERFGALDILVNNASLLGPRLPVIEYPVEVWEEVIRVNIGGVFLMSRQALQTMVPRGRGSIINLSSGVGRVGKARWGAYAPSKFAVEGFTQMLAEEVRGAGVRVNAVNPGATRTSMRAAAYPDEDPSTLPEPAALMEPFVYLASDESEDVTGKSFDAQNWQPRD